MAEPAARPAARAAARPAPGPGARLEAEPLTSSEAACDRAVLGPALRAERGVRHGDLLGSGVVAPCEEGLRAHAPEDAAPVALGTGQSSRTWSRD